MKRPLPPLLFRQTALLALVTGMAAQWWAAAWAVLLLLIWLDSRSHDRLRLLLVLGAALAGFGYAGWRAAPVPETPAWMQTRQSVTLSGTVSAVRGLPGERLRVLLEQAGVRGKTCASTLPGRVVWTWDAPLWRPLPGERIQLTGRVSPATGFRNDDADRSLYWPRQGVFWRVYSAAGQGEPRRVERAAGAALREAWHARLIDTLNQRWPLPPHTFSYGVMPPAPPHGWGLLPALLFGDRFFLSVADTELLAQSGLAHSIALSGQHLAVAGLAALLLIQVCGGLYPALFLRLPRPRLILTASLPLAATYLWLGSAPPSLWRAALMLACWTLYRWRKRPAAFPDALIAALVCMAVADPVCLTDAGLQLSFASVAGIALLSPLFERLWTPSPDSAASLKAPAATLAGRVTRLLGRTAASVLICSLVVQMATLPLILALFGRLAPWFPLNVLWLPVLSVWVLPLAFLCLGCVVAGWGAGAGVLAALAAEPCHWLLEGLRALSATGWLESLWLPRPHWTSGLGWALLVLALAVALSGRTLRAARKPALAGVFLLLCGPALWLWQGQTDTVTLRVLDVGQAQAVLVEAPGHRRLLIDGGGSRSARFDTGRDVLAPILAANSPLAVDALLFTHADTDHLRGLLFLASQFRVGRALMPPQGPADNALRAAFCDILQARGIPVSIARAGERVELGRGLGLEVLAALASADSNAGLVLRLTQHGRGLALIPGDAGAGDLGRLARSGLDIRAEVLVAPHHGSARSVSTAFLRAVAPREVLISCGVNNAFGFPSARLKDALRAQNIPWRSTAEEGELRAVWRLE